MNKYVSVDMLKKMTWEISCEDKFRFIAVSVADIDSAPSIDIIRCRECKYGEYREEFDDYECHYSGCGLVYTADDFCSCGERDE